MAKILVTDLDGTLFYPKKKLGLIGKENLAFLREWVDNGNKLVLASGRNYKDADKILKKIGREATFIGCNSAVIYENGKIVYEDLLDGKEIIKLMERIESRFDPSNYVVMTENYNTYIYSRKYKPSFRCIYPLYKLSQGRYGSPYKIVRKSKFIKEIKNGRIFKLMCFFGIGHRNSVRASIVSKYLSKYESNYESNWSSISIEFNNKGCTKANGIKKYLEMHNYSKDDVYVIGDSGNDVCMFKEFYDRSFCMKHSNSSIKKYAKTIVDNVYEIKDYIK